MSDSDLEIGTVLSETYVLTGQLGAGGMGVVYKAKHQRLPKQVAVKVLHQFVAADKDAFTRFRREAEIASEIDHPHIVQALDFNTLDDGRPYLVLEYLRGQSLRERLDATSLPLEATLSVASQIASGLAAAHSRGVVHRDLKPENIFLSQPEGTATPQVKILDFGISKLLGTQSLTQDGMMIGTPFYMSPEQAQGQAVDARTDQFALAAMVYEMLGGRPPFWGDQPLQVLFQVVHQEPPPLSQLASSVPSKVVEVINRGLSKKADQRFPEVGAFALALWQASGIKPPRDSMVGLRSSASSDSQVDATTGPTLPTLDAGTGPTLPPLDAATGPTLHAATPEAMGIAPTMASPAAPSPAFAPTLDSQGAMPANAQPATLPPAPQPAAASGSSGAKIAIFVTLGLLLVGGGATAAYVILKQETASTTAPPATKVERAADATSRPINATAKAPARADAGAPAVDSRVVAKASKKTKKKTLRRKQRKKKIEKRGAKAPPTTKATAGSTTPPPAALPRLPLSKALKQEKKTIWKRYWAKKYTKMLDRLRSFDNKLKPAQRWISNQLHTVAFCGLEDLEKAKIYYAQLPARARAKARRLCKMHGGIDPS